MGIAYFRKYNVQVTMAPAFFSSTEGYRVQKTLGKSLHFSGVGLHSGVSTKLALHPAPANHGILFERLDLNPAVKIPGHFDSIVSTAMATSLGIPGRPEATIATVEHLMAAFYALGLTNVRVEVSGPEIPILDGSAFGFVEEILKGGIVLQNYSQPVLRVIKPIKVYRDGTICELLPRERLRLTTSVDFPHPSIGLQTFALELTPEAFCSEVGRARTFGFQSDLEKLRSRNLALGASLENVLAFSETGVLNPDGPRYTDECVRHKLLDAIGDLALCGCWIEGEMVSFRGGHSIHLTLLKSLKEFKTHWELLPASPLHATYQKRKPEATFARALR